ncbi:ABC transporter ATP-binding protein [Rhodoferax sp.]|uniref:ABC transporter ATP-binding protein n=1 Tax=Rhodoferax sp. TaxID=50421 RepID=UPI002629052A|nr:ABC transporter ATP-binding protein [Rhodoferax sp.]MDD2920218.1 ABC transporter ATP-binding protein [Rhodoferax sp.]
MASVSVRNLCIRFGDNEVIKGLNLDVVESEFLVLLGPSGCGKSTLLHSIAGLIDVADGSVVIGGQDMTWADPTDRNIGMVFQSYALYPTMSVERNMSFGLRVKGTPKAEIERRVQRAAQMLQLEPLLNRKPSQLSGGQRQRVAIGRALVREAGVFLFDEPLSNLDAKLRAELRRELKLLHKNLRSTMIYVTHDQVEAMTLATRIVVMLGGKIQQIGAPAQVYEKPQNLFVAGFLGSPGMNLLSGQLGASVGSMVFESKNLTLDVGAYAFLGRPVAAQPVILGIRPENLLIHAGGAHQGTVSLIEPMGNHHVVWLDFGGKLLSSVVSGALGFSVDEPVRFTIDLSKISLFNQTTGQRL